ncbi:MAG: glutathione S-transferase family protein [Verrucomicrobiota bacterium]
MKVISMKICPYVQQVRALLEAKGAKYEVEHIQQGDHPRSEWLLKASPDGGEVPVLVTDEGESLFQSDTIVEYLDEVLGDPFLQGTPLERAKDKAWGRLAADNYLTQCSTQRSPDEETLEERTEDLTPLFAATEGEIGGGPYFRGEKLRMVDLSWLPILHRTSLIKKHSDYDFLAGYPKLQAWREAVLATGIHKNSVSEDFEDVFTGFYLSDETFLGRKRAN